MDWGSAKPFSVNWMAISDGTMADYPRGALINYREWYGVASKPNGTFEPNVGVKMTAEKVGAGIAEREMDEKVSNDASVMDPAAFAVISGPSVAERVYEGSGRKVAFRRADNRRVGKKGAFIGWDSVRARLQGNDEGVPMIYFMDCCPHIIRTLPVLQHDEARPEDVDTDGEDHGPDSIRYACMSRPYLPANQPKPTPVFKDMNTMTVSEIWDSHERQSRRDLWR
jgi:hypothetical protein